MKFSDMSIRDMLQKIIEKKAPYSQDRVQMAVNGFEQYSGYAKEIIERLEKNLGIDEKEDD